MSRCTGGAPRMSCACPRPKIENENQQMDFRKNRNIMEYAGPILTELDI